MWTPKRVILLAAGFAVFLGAYIVYAYFLGGIDGLPPLPVSFYPVENSSGPPVVDPDPPVSLENSTNNQLRLAFGDSCNEVKYKIKLELQPRGMVLATEDWEVLVDGRVLLTPFSLAIIRRDPGAAGYPEINTVQCKKAYLRFDRPVTKLYEMSSRKIVGAELCDDILLMNNRRTKERNDDISLFTHGPLHYDESRHLIWTDAAVRVVDMQSKPKPMTIEGFGMDIDLTPNTNPLTAKQAGANGAKSGAPAGVDRIRLRSEVVMDLWVDPGSGFLTPSKKPPQTPASSQAAAPKTGTKETVQVEKATVQIRTQGPFVYDLRTDRAVFEIAHRPGNRPNVVTVDRFKESEGKVDHLQCDDRLELQFRRKNPSGIPAPADNRPEGLDIETVHAAGKEVIITSEAELLNAQGTDFFYDTRTKLTTLKGLPRMWAIKEGTLIEAPELQLFDQKEGQQATALGEGRVSLFDAKTTSKRPIEATWKKKFIYAKEGTQDLLTLIGNASFKDNEHLQMLKADTLKVWLEPAESGPGAGGDQQHRKPRHLDAVKDVWADGPDMHVHDTDHLEVWFKDAPANTGRLPATLPDRPQGGDALQGARPSEDNDAVRTPGEKARPQPDPGSTFPATPANQAKNKKPIDLSARLVETHVLRVGEKNDLDWMHCEGKVHVRQEPATPMEKGVDIHGETLELHHHLDGDRLDVMGDHAQVQLNQICIVGTNVHIDQTTNETWVEGMGVMRLLSKSNLDGTPLAHETEMVINWDESMVFDGQRAIFKGQVRATQDNGHLSCQKEMTVNLDRKVSLREGDKGKEPARVQKVLCERNVWGEDTTYRTGTRVLVSYKRLQGQDLDADVDSEKNDSIVHISGPGMVRIFQLGNKGEVFPAAQPARAANNQGQQMPQGQKKEEEFKLTQVAFQGMMVANNKQGTATFYDGVVLVHVPTDDRNLKINELAPPPESFRLSCRELHVLSHKAPDGTAQQEMRAVGRVSILGQDFQGSADTVSFDESKDQLILQGTPGNLAVLVKQPAKGAERMPIRAEKIFYWPKSGNIHVEKATMIGGSK